MLKPICHSGSIKVPEYLETDKEKNAGRTPLSCSPDQLTVQYMTVLFHFATPNFF